MTPLVLICVTASAVSVALALCALLVCLQSRRGTRYLRESFESLLAAQRTEWSIEMEKLRVARAAQIERADATPVDQPTRKQAMKLFRAGIAPDTVAAKLGLPRQEMRLAAKVFRLLSNQAG